ncbi:nucleotidyl transferase AbiEii/AbiGii toxin family protein [Candidatus Gribaldobacteria bacterium]|nr:nucleotidyl transferase AbiEii/AbiGii toxin family protein [Candidatus Gribaldobacteria bacterium]
MLNKEKHLLIMTRLLRDIYSETSLAPLIGFKGGTCCYLLHGLNRFSVDLDFDLIINNESARERVYQKVGELLKKYGEVKDRHNKHNTLFFLLSYGDADHNIKLEISIRTKLTNIKDYYELKEYLGISLLSAKKDYLFASKLVALTSRRTVAMRDIFDVWFFAKNNWDINPEIIKTITNKTIKDHLADCVSTIKAVKDNEILHGLAELLPNEKAKIWVKKDLREEAIFLLKNYQAVLK